jgi:hypothetical protein
MNRSGVECKVTDVDRRDASSHRVPNHPPPSTIGIARCHCTFVQETTSRLPSLDRTPAHMFILVTRSRGRRANLGDICIRSRLIEIKENSETVIKGRTRDRDPQATIVADLALEPVALSTPSCLVLAPSSPRSSSRDRQSHSHTQLATCIGPLHPQPNMAQLCCPPPASRHKVQALVAGLFRRNHLSSSRANIRSNTTQKHRGNILSLHSKHEPTPGGHRVARERAMRSKSIQK